MLKPVHTRANGHLHQRAQDQDSDAAASKSDKLLADELRHLIGAAAPAFAPKAKTCRGGKGAGFHGPEFSSDESGDGPGHSITTATGAVVLAYACYWGHKAAQTVGYAASDTLDSVSAAAEVAVEATWL